MTNTTQLFLTSIFIFFSWTMQAQTYVSKQNAPEKILKLYKEGLSFARQGHDHKALASFEKALKKSPNFIDAIIEKAGVHYRMGKIDESVKHLERAIQLDAQYNIAVLYTLGSIYMDKDDYAKAIAAFEKYLQSPLKQANLVAKVEKLLGNSRFAQQAIKNPVPFNPTPLGNKINTYNSEYLPSLTADGEVLIYTLRMGGQEDFYVSKKVQGEWLAGVPLSEFINTPENEGAQCIAADGKTFIFTACNRQQEGFGSCDLYVSTMRDGDWSKPQNLGAPLNTKNWESQPSLSADGSSLYFSSDREGTQGSRDIWVSRKQANGKWGKPENLGNVINTTDEEQAPFIHADGKTLYFMSRGHEGMGGHDLFVSKLLENGQWSKPQNLGYPINTKASEGSLFVALDGKTAYYATDRQEKGNANSAFNKNDIRANTDLYQFELPPLAHASPVTYVKASVVEFGTKKPLLAAITITDLNNGKTVTTAQTDEQGHFLMCLPLGKNYAMNVSKEKFAFHSEHFELKEITTLEQPFLLNIQLQAIPNKEIVVTNNNTNVNSVIKPKSKPIILHNVFFETNSADLKPESVTELLQLKQLLYENKSLNIQINGHTDNVGTDLDNLKLSENRAKAVRDFLIKQGISESRLRYKGFGEMQPIADNETSDGRRLNRRTEFLILE